MPKSMARPIRYTLWLLGGLVLAGCSQAEAVTERRSVGLPEPDAGSALLPGTPLDTAYFAGGCFWGIQAVFQHLKGVTVVTSGYSGGKDRSPDYEGVSSGATGHAESVRVVYDPAVVSYGTLLKVFFSVAHDPTELNRQGPDVGTQYRSAIFYRTPEQQATAAAYVAQLNGARVFHGPIVTELTTFSAFYVAEEYHQDYATLHPNAAYIVVYDAPKLAALKAEFPELWSEAKAGS